MADLKGGLQKAEAVLRDYANHAGERLQQETEHQISELHEAARALPTIPAESSQLVKLATLAFSKEINLSDYPGEVHLNAVSLDASNGRWQVADGGQKFPGNRRYRAFFFLLPIDDG